MGLSLAAYRGYDPEIRRWLSEDPGGMLDGPNLYAYVRNQPTKLIDPSGLCSCNDECQSGKWKLHSLTAEGGSFGLTFLGGVGVLTCTGRPWVMKRVKVFCANMGIYMGAGVSLTVQIRGADLQGPCNKKDITEYRTTGRIVAVGPTTIEGETKPEALGFGASLGGGIAISQCRVVPW